MSGGLSAKTVAEVQQVLGCILPEPLLEIYRLLGSTEADHRVEMRLMSPKEVISFHQIIHDEEWGGLVAKGVRAFWTDDNGNCTGLYITGPLDGKLCFIDHEEVDLSPAYASVQSFIDAMTAASAQELGWPEFRRDYPSGPFTDPQAALRDWEIAQSLRPVYEASRDRERIYHACCIMALTPFSKTETLLAFTYDEDMYIQARACEIMGSRRYEAATGRLADVARNGMHNGQIAAILALGKIGSIEARSHLRGLFSALPEGYSLLIKGALTEPQGTMP